MFRWTERNSRLKCEAELSNDAIQAADEGVFALRDKLVRLSIGGSFATQF
jgi:hypothetical protein